MFSLMTQPYPLTGTLPTPSTRKRLPLRLRSNGLVGSDERHSQGLNQIKSLSPHHRFVIALHSPVKVTETGLRMCRPEKGRQIDAIRSRAVRSLQSALRTKYYDIRASLHISRQNAGQFLCG